MELPQKEWALVTGASKGLGYEYVEQLLIKNYNVIAVARDTSTLDILMTKYPNSKITCFNYDLSNIDNCKKLYQDCAQFDVTILINNAGYGLLGNFKDLEWEKELNMLQLNILALHFLTKLFLNRFLVSQKGRIINISSIAGFIPGPHFSSYYASKAYVLNLGEAINTELKITNQKIRIITICPGPLKTAFWQRSGMAQEIQEKQVRNMNLNLFAKKSLSKALKTSSKNKIIFGFWNRLFLFSCWILPNNIILKIIYKYQSKR